LEEQGLPHEDAKSLLERSAGELAQIDRRKHFSLWREDTRRTLGEELMQVEPFKTFADTWIFTGDGGGAVAHGRFGDWAINRLVDNMSADGMLAEFAAEVARNTAIYAEISPAFGVQVDELVELEHGVTIEPEPEEMLASFLHRSPFQSLPLPTGTSVLRQSFKVTPAFELREPGTSAPGSGSITVPTSLEREAVRQRVRLACLLSSAGPVELPFSGLQPDRRGLFVAGEGNQAGRPYAAIPLVSFPVSGAALRQAFHRLGAVRGIESLARAIDRIGRSRLAANPVDRALDLGIAAEIVLMHDHSPANTEIAHKIGGRAAWLLGRDPGEREMIFKEMKLLYQARSQAAHSGTLSSKANHDLDSADRLVTRVFNAILERGSFPEWNNLVMGGGAELQGEADAT
jgi:hypothetical protein